MYSTKIEIQGKEFRGKLNIKTLVATKEFLKKDLKKEYTINQIFEEVSKNNYQCISALLIQVIINNNDITLSDFLKVYKQGNETIQAENSIKIYTFINELIEKGMSLKDKVESEFEDIPDLKNNEEWDLSRMEYMWKSVLKRNDSFEDITPKNYFEQLEIYKESVGSKKEEVEYI